MAIESPVGAWMPREDGGPKVTGKAAYAADMRFPGLLSAWLVLSPYAHARIVHIDTDAARQVPGVVGVFTAADLPLVEPEDLTRSRDPLARDRVFFEGQPVVAVVAESDQIAEDAANLVVVEYEPLEAAVDPIATLGDERELVHGAEKLGLRDDAGAHTSVSEHTQKLPRPANATTAQRYTRGDIEGGFRAADVVAEHTYRTSWVHQSYLEPQSCVVVPEPTGGLTIYSSTQGSFFVRNEVAKALGIPQHEVRVFTAEVGGAFGAKYAVIDPLVAGLAVATGRPVRLTYTRSDEFLAGVPAPGTVMQVKTGATRDGTLTALQATIIVDTGSFPGGTAGIIALLLGGTYRFPNLQIDAYEVLTNKPGCGAYRAPGAPQACFAIEGQVEELARQLGLDPMEFRLKNASVEGDPMPGGSAWPRIGSLEVLQTLRDHPLWQNRHQKAPGEGIGIAFGGWPGGTQPAAAVCRLNDDGSISIVTGASDISGTKTGFAILAANAFGVDLDQVNVRAASTDVAPFAGAAGGSKITFTVGQAVMRAAEDARRQVLEVVAERLEVSPADLEIVGDRVQVRGVPDSGMTLKEVARITTAFGGRYQPIMGNGRAAPAPAAPGFIAHLARVHVDQETGEVRVLDYVAVQDVGRAINPGGIEDQVHGGVTQGVGWALFEHMVYDDDGHLRTGSFMDYAIPKSTEAPHIEAIVVEVPYPEGPLGARGVGEPPIVGGAAAIANAIYDATGVRLNDIPMTPERVLAALQQGDGHVS